MKRAGGRSPPLCTWAVAILVSIVVLGNVVLYMRSICNGRVNEAEITTARRYEEDIARLQAALGAARSETPQSSVLPSIARTPEARSLRRANLGGVWGVDRVSQDNASLPEPPSQKSVAPSPGDAAPLEPAPVSPAAARALLVICYNRPAYLERTLTAVLGRLPRYNRPHVYVSQDGAHAGVTGVIEDFARRFAQAAPDVPFTHWRHPDADVRVPPDQAQYAGYYKLAQHFGWALGRLFGPGAAHPFVIVLEDDLEIAVDFFDYMTATESLLASDESLLAVSAWSDLGQAPLVADARAVLRSDFFPGLGWMLDRRRWRAELAPKWPQGFWDDWLREPPQRRGRAFLRPEVSRTYTFGEQGVSQAQFFGRYLATVRLNEERVDWAAQDLSYLAKQTYDAWLAAAVAAGARVAAADAFARSCQPPQQGQQQGRETIVAPYNDEASYARLADEFGFISDRKAGIARSAYLGVTTLQHRGCRKLLVSADSPLLLPPPPSQEGKA